MKSIVDKNGFLHRSPGEFFAGRPDYSQIEKEFCAQVNLISKKYGVKLGYLDTHYLGGEGPKYRKLNEVIARVAKKYKLPVSGSVNDKMMLPGVYHILVEKKIPVLAGQLEKLQPGLWLLMTHLLVKSVDSGVLMHTEPKDVMKGGVGNLRPAETQCLISSRIKAIIKKRNIQLIDYKMLKNK